MNDKYAEGIKNERDRRAKERDEAERDADYLRGTMEAIGNGEGAAAEIARLAVKGSEERKATILTGRGR